MNYVSLVCYAVVFWKTVSGGLPLVINTWEFEIAAAEAWSVLQATGNSLDALVEGINRCEREQCGFAVGFGAKPDESGETTLDAMIMNGSDFNMGAVANLRGIKDSIKVAKHVLLHTKHSILSGDQATEFAQKMGFEKESLASDHSRKQYFDWIKNNCQPNFWTNVVPDPTKYCGPYRTVPFTKNSFKGYKNHNIGNGNHDTIGMLVIDENGQIFSGGSTNGLINKIPGRVGDSPIPGGGTYCDNNYGAAVSTGDGDEMMRHLPSFLAVQLLRSGYSPKEAADEVVRRIMVNYPNFSGAVIVADKGGNYAVACNNMEYKNGVFQYSVANEKGVRIESVICSSSQETHPDKIVVWTES